jgi:uncharacterized membrane protein YcaP (DUF421 family)
MVAAAVMALLHVLLAHGVARSQGLAHLVEGEAVTLIDHGRIDHYARKRSRISEADLREALREHGIDGETKADNVKAMRLEPSGKLSVVKVDPCEQDRD